MSDTLSEKLKKSIARRGAVGTALHAGRAAVDLMFSPITARWRLLQKRRIRRAVDDQFDREHGVDTSGTIEPNQLGVDGPNVEHATLYQAVYPQPFSQVMRQLPLALERLVFIDIGCGKGRAIFLAATYPFREIIGVEFSPQLQRIASGNLASYKGPRRCDRISVLCQDAVDFEFPREPSLIFMYNPFDHEVMARVAANLDRSLREHPRPLAVVYFNPKVPGPWDAAETLAPLAVEQPAWPGFRGRVVSVWISKQAQEP